ncbi:MAG: hypothetical protein ACRC33_21880, partial [Gemmataceae bacterium]
AGPGRGGWGPDAEPPAAPGLEHPEIRALFAELLAALEPFPEAREVAAAAIAARHRDSAKRAQGGA